MGKYRFGVYTHQLVTKDTLITRCFIVINEQESQATVMWTDFDKYIHGGRKSNIRALQCDNRKQFRYVVKLLNFVFFDKNYIRKLNELTIEMIKEFLNDYGLMKLPTDTETSHRQRSTVEECQSYIMEFIISLIRAGKVRFKESDLYKTENVFSKRKKRTVTKNVPVFEVMYVNRAENTIYRDIPEKAFKVIFDMIVAKHMRLLMLVALSAFAGLRPSESCNVRRADSALGPGIRFEIIDGEIYNIFIDISKKKNIRSDLKNVGGIKRYRTQKVYPAFLNAFYECYQAYMKYIEGSKYEGEYGALTCNAYGKALTYNTYYREFQTVIDECIPIMIKSDDPQLVNYGLLLQERRISPHIFRHWYSAKLALYGEDPASLMYWRGDRSPESALTYIQNKSDLIRMFSSTVEKIFDYTQWKAKKEYGRKKD